MGETGSALTSSLLDLVFEEAGAGRCLVGPDDKILRANAEWLRSTGRELGGALGADIVALSPGTRDATLALHARARAGHHVEVPSRAQRIQGRETWWKGSIDPVPMDGGTGLLITVRESSPEREAVDRTLRENEQRYSVLFDRSPFAIALTRMPGIVTVSVNDAFLRLFECTREAVVGKTSVELGISDAASQARVKAALEQGGAVRNLEVIRRTTAGAELVLSLSVDLVEIGGERFVLTTIQDITDRHRAEAALRLSEARFRAVLDNSLDCHYQVNLQTGRFEYISPAVEHLTGYPPDELLAEDPETALGMVHPADEPALRAALERLEETGKASVEYRLRTKSGAYRWLSNHMSLTRDGAGRPLYRDGAILDVTDQKVAAQAIRESEDRHRRLVEQVSDGIFLANAEGRYTDVNQAGCEMLGMTRDEVLASTFLDILVPDEHPRLAEAIASFADGKVHRSEWRFRRKDGSVLVGELDGRRSPDGRFHGVLRDVTERRRLQDVLVESDRRKSEFLAVLSHELRNPLTPIRNSVYLLERAPLESDRARRACEVIHRQTEHLTRLVDDLLDVTRISKGKVELQPHRVDLGDVVRKSVDDARSLFERRGIDLRVEPLGAAWIVADPVRIAQVVGNILHNAQKFTAPGGVVTVGLVTAGTRVELHVKDTGVGMTPGHEHRMFEPFVQGDQGLARTQGGLGLGLALVKSLVDMHGGSVRAASEGIGRGTELVVSLPLAGDPEPERAARESGRVAGRDVLVVEDNPDAAQSLADILALGGHRVRVALDGRSGIELARSSKPDVMICDVGLPDIDGYEIARRVRADPALAGIQLIALTGYAQPEDRRRALEAGFDSHLAKPPVPGDLQVLLQQAGASR